MFGINGYDDEEDQLQKLLGLKPPETNQQEGYQVQELPQIAQGLLGGTGAENRPQLSGGAANMAAQLAQAAQAASQSSDDGGLAQRNASTQQQAQQAFAQQQQQQQQAGQIFGQLLKMYLTGGFE